MIPYTSPRYIYHSLPFMVVLTWSCIILSGPSLGDQRDGEKCNSNTWKQIPPFNFSFQKRKDHFFFKFVLVCLNPNYCITVFVLIRAHASISFNNNFFSVL